MKTLPSALFLFLVFVTRLHLLVHCTLTAAINTWSVFVFVFCFKIVLKASSGVFGALCQDMSQTGKGLEGDCVRRRNSSQL